LITGALDAFTLTENGATISGWAYRTAEGERLPVTIGVTGIRTAKVESFPRPDIGGTHAFGIRLVLESPVDLLALVVGTARCVAGQDGQDHAIPIWEKLKGRILSAFMVRSAQALDADGRAELFGALLAPIRSSPGTPQADTTPLSLEVGFRSYDNAVVVGRDGHLFLEAGSNKVSRMYAEPAAEAKVAGWIDLIKRRRHRIGDAGAAYLQLIIPEKQSVLGHAHPAGDIGCTPLFDAIATRLANTPHHVDVLSIFRMLSHRGLAPYRQVDTHLSFHGCQALVAALATRIAGRTVEPEMPLLAARPATGDLGNKIGFGNVVEQCLYPVEQDWLLAQRDVRLVHRSDPASGHIGSLRRWSCDDAPIGRRVLIFGNSMFERGGRSLTLSWWFARMFREVCFVWSPTVDMRLVAEWSPDVVVCQTVERFLGNVPAD
jgi:hypothetical protein